GSGGTGKSWSDGGRCSEGPRSVDATGQRGGSGFGGREFHPFHSRFTGWPVEEAPGRWKNPNKRAPGEWEQLTFSRSQFSSQCFSPLSAAPSSRSSGKAKPLPGASLGLGMQL